MELPRKVDPRDIVGLSDIAKRLDVDPSLPSQWARRFADFPAPIAKVAMGRLYDWAEISAWLETHRPYGRLHSPRT